MSIELYRVFHIVSLLILTGYTFYAFAAPAETRKRVLMITGIAGLLMLVSGVGLMHKIGHQWTAGWIWVKIVCWLGLSAIAGMAYRRRQKIDLFKMIAVILLVVAVCMVFYKPF